MQGNIRHVQTSNTTLINSHGADKSNTLDLKVPFFNKCSEKKEKYQKNEAERYDNMASKNNVIKTDFRKRKYYLKYIRYADPGRFSDKKKIAVTLMQYWIMDALEEHSIHVNGRII